MRRAGELTAFSLGVDSVLPEKCVRAVTHLCVVIVFFCLFFCAQLNQALAGKFNAHVHVEYEWCLQHEDLDESDEDLDEKVRRTENVT